MTTVPAPDAELRPVTLRVLIEGAPGPELMEVVGHLADFNGAEPVVIDDLHGVALATWLSFSAGRYEQSPLRLEVLAIASKLAEGARRSMLDAADAIVFVTGCTADGLEAGARQLQASGLAGTGLASTGLQGTERPPNDLGLVVFAHRADPDPDPDPDPADDNELAADDVLEKLGLPADTGFTFTSPEGDGVRVGFTLAVRLGLLRLGENDAQGLERTKPSSPSEMRALLVSDTREENGQAPVSKLASSPGLLKWLPRRWRES